MFEVFMSGFSLGVVGILLVILIIQKLENYQFKQDTLHAQAEAYNKARREGRI
jgi:hypothetical protein